MTTQTAFDLIVRNALSRSSAVPVDIGVKSGRIAAIEPKLACEGVEVDLGGRLALPGFVDTHIHLDKACLLGRCGHNHASVSEAIRAVAGMKKDFTVEDVYARGARVLERAIVHGTTRMRTHVEIDPRIALRGYEAIKALKRDPAPVVVKDTEETAENQAGEAGEIDENGEETPVRRRRKKIQQIEPIIDPETGEIDPDALSRQVGVAQRIVVEQPDSALNALRQLLNEPAPEGLE